MKSVIVRHSRASGNPDPPPPTESDDPLLTHPHFIEEINAAKREYEAGGGLSLQQVKELLAD